MVVPKMQSGKTVQRGKAMEKRKHIIFFIVFSIAVFLSVGILGIQKSTVLSESTPHFNGSELEYKTGIYDIVSEIILFFYAALWLASAVLYALSSQNKTIKKIIAVPCILLLGTVTLFIAALLYIGPTYNSFEYNYSPKYYVVYDRDKTVKLLFAEGMYSFDAKTKVYFLDSNDNAHFIGQFSAEEMLQGGKYDVLYRDNAVSFSYNYGIYDENHNPVYHNVTFNLPET